MQRNSAQRNSIWLAHKYWWKKPYFLSNYIILNYTKENDIILDPFCWSGSLIIDWIFQNRNIIWIDINPVSIYFNKIITNGEYYKNIVKIWKNEIKPKLLELEKKYYTYDWKIIKSILRKKEWDYICWILFKDWSIIEDISDNNINNFEIKIHSWFNKKLVKNSRLSVKENTKVINYFSDLSVTCHTEILNIIEKYDENIKNFFKIAFTANLANCSKLLPPIKSRWKFQPWAWMTWFYIPSEFLDNNVYHYYFNRVEKLLKAKLFFEEKVNKNNFWDIQQVIEWKTKYNFSIGNSMNLKIPNKSIDIIITDPPYEWVVPYLEQSSIWNAFFEDTVDMKNEIIISDAKERWKNKDVFKKELQKAFKEFNRVLKNKSNLIFTYNSIDIENLNTLSSLLEESWFELKNIFNITQKTATPRQINRENTVKWDLLIVCEKKEIINKFIFSENLLAKLENINYLNFNQPELWLFRI